MGLPLPKSLSFHPASALFEEFESLSSERRERVSGPALLDFAAQEQTEDNWCWSAVATSVGLFYGTGNWTQCEVTTEQVNGIISPGEHNDCCATPDSSKCDVYGFLYFSLQHVRSLDHWESQKPTADALFEILSRHRELLCLRIAWGLGGAHFTTIYGCTNPADGGEPMVSVSDTIRGVGTTTMPYSLFPSRYLNGGSWTDTFRTRGRFGPAADAGPGSAAAIAIDNHGNCILVRIDQGGLFHRVGRIDAINKLVTWGTDSRFESGTSAAVSLDNDGNCVEVHSNGSKLFYRLGKLDVSGMSITWQSVEEYGVGVRSAVALADYGVAVEAHVTGNQLHYRVGSVEDNGTITWGPSTQYGTGATNAITIDNLGNCLQVNVGVEATSGKLYYRVGKINYLTSSISWGAEAEFEAGDLPSVSLTATGKCLAVFSGTGAASGKVVFRAGKVNTEARTVEWYPRNVFDAGEAAVAALDDIGKSIGIYVSGQRLFARIGR